MSILELIVVIFIGLFVLALLVIIPTLFFISLYKAIERKTGTWILVCVLSGLLALPIVIAVIFYFCAGALMEEDESFLDAIPAQLQSMTITGNTMPYQLTVPDASGWMRMDGVDGFDVVLSNEADLLQVAVAVEPSSLETLENAHEYVLSHLQNVDGVEIVDEPERVTIDGHKWLRFDVFASELGGVEVVHRIYLYTGDEGTFRIVAWTGKVLFDERKALMDKIARSFVFPPEEGPASEN